MLNSATQGDMEVIRQFAHLLLPFEAPEGSVAHVFGLPSRMCLWAADSEGLAAAAQSLCTDGDDTYVGLSLRKQGLGRFSRGKGKELTYALGIGVDIDIDFDGIETKKKRFPSIDAALDCSARVFPLPPTAIINSGGGIHLWWLYKEPLDLSNQEDRNFASNLAMEWHKRIADAARFEGGYNVDSTFDLERILRFPGTFNRKIPGKPRPVVLLEMDHERRYDPGEMSDSIALDPSELSRKTTDERVVASGRLQMDPNAAPPLTKKLALLENDDRFAMLLRRDFACSKWLKDTSASGYDLALANITVRAGWTDQEIVDLLISNRSQHGDDLKLRERYYGNTISQARKGFDGTSRSAREIIKRTEAVQQEQIVEIASIPDKIDRREEIFSRLAKATGVDVVRIISNGRDPARYRLEMRNNDTLFIENTKALRMQDTWLEKALETNSPVPTEPLSQKNWRLLVGYLSEVLEFEKEGDSLGDAICEYIDKAVDLSDEQTAEYRGGVLANGRPVILDNGYPAIHAPSFLRWLADCGRKTEPATLKSRLRSYGFESKTLSFRTGKGKGEAGASSRTYWVAVDPEKFGPLRERINAWDVIEIGTVREDLEDNNVAKRG